MTRGVRYGLLATAAIALVGGVGFAATKDHLLPESSPAARGFEVAEHAGCFSCHGLDPQAAAKDPKVGRAVPGMLEVRRGNPGLRRIVAYGSHKGSPFRKAGKLGMPAYRDRLEAEEVDDLVAWLALEQYRRSEPVGLPEGERLARAHGCFACHGALGQGGVANAGSMKGYIPGFFGKDFDALTFGGDREMVRAWIRDGAPKAFLEQGLLGIRPAEYFTKRQAIAMPAYADRLSEAELEALVDLCLEIRRLGPLDADGVEAYRRRAALRGR